MQIIKSITARQLFKQYPEIKKTALGWWTVEWWRLHWNYWRWNNFRCYQKLCWKSWKQERKRSISANENTRFLIAITTRAVAQTYPVACSGVRQRNFDLIRFNREKSRASLSINGYLDQKYYQKTPNSFSENCTHFYFRTSQYQIF